MTVGGRRCRNAHHLDRSQNAGRRPGIAIAAGARGSRQARRGCQRLHADLRRSYCWTAAPAAIHKPAGRKPTAVGATSAGDQFRICRLHPVQLSILSGWGSRVEPADPGGQRPEPMVVAPAGGHLEPVSDFLAFVRPPAHRPGPARRRATQVAARQCREPGEAIVIDMRGR